MKSSCISHPPKTPLVIIREEYLAICDGSHCEAAILNQFEYWTNIKLGHKEQTEIEGEIARAGGVEITSGDLWIYKSQTDLHEELMGLFGIRAVGMALQSLVDRGFLERRNNPKYAWDRTYQYRLQTTEVQDAILQKCKFERSGAQHQKQQKGDIESDQNEAALPKTTLEIPPKETTEKESVAFSENSEQPLATHIADDFDAGTEKMWGHYQQAAANKEAGRDYATPAQAGGADGLAAFGLFCLYDKRGKSPPLPGTKQHSQQCAKVRDALRAYGYQQASPELVEKAAELLCEQKGNWTNVFYPSFVMDFGNALQDADYFLKHGRLPDDSNRQKQGRPKVPHQSGPDVMAEATAMTLERLGYGN